MKILIVTEQAESRNLILQAVEREVNKKEILEAATAFEAIKLMKRHDPEFLFLDVQLSDGSGFEVAELIKQLDLTAQVILMGEDVQYAVDAFRMRAFYYLLKPFQNDELAYLASLIEKERRKKGGGVLQKLPIENHEGISYIFPNEIIYVSKNKENKTVSIYTKEAQFTSAYTLQELEDKLTLHHFLRVHKSYLVNLLYIKGLRPYYNGTYNLYLAGCMDCPIPVSRNYVKRLRHKIEI